VLNPGKILDRKYEIIKILGQGGMGTVYLCKNSRLGNLWAIKEVNSQWKDKIDFLAEPNILKNLSHIGIIRIIDIFYEEDNLYIVEDYIEGETLTEFIRATGPLASELVEDLSLQLCSILDYLHSFTPPIIYRDLKPSNIMIKPNNKVVLIDFGIARTYKKSQEGDTMVLGSVGYIAPEQLMNSQSNAQTDIYSLGATMFFMLTGKTISLPTELMVDENYPEGISKGLIKVIQMASAAEPKNRYGDAKLMVADLNAIVSDRDSVKTILMNSNEPISTGAKTFLIENKKPSKRIKIFIMAGLVCVIVLIVFSAMHLGNKPSDKNTLKSTTPPKTTTTAKPAKEIIEKDTIVNGIITINNPNTPTLDKPTPGPGNEKRDPKNKKPKENKNEDKNLPLQVTLNPVATVSNSKLSVSLTNIQIIDNKVTVTLSIENINRANLELNLDQTYLVNDKNKSTKVHTEDSTSRLVLSKEPNTQEVKLIFKDLNFQDSSSYTLKTVLNSDENKTINLYMEVKH